jgi:hypothetical protein
LKKGYIDHVKRLLLFHDYSFVIQNRSGTRIHVETAIRPWKGVITDIVNLNTICLY